MGQASTRPKGYCRSARAAEEGVGPRLRLGLGHRQPDDLLGLLRRAGPGRTADTPDPPGAGHGHLRHADPSRARGGDGDAEPAGAGPCAPGHRHRQHGDAHDGPATHAHRGVRRVPARAGRPAARRDGGLPLPRPRSSHLGLEPKIPLYVSGFGPRAIELAGKHGDGLVFAIPPRGVAVADALGHARKGAARAGRALDGFRSCALTNVALLEPGEPVDSPRVVRTVGPNVMASVYRNLRPIWKRYCALVKETPAAHWHFRTHEFHYTYLHPGEAELIDASLIRATCLVGTAEALVEQVRELERQGLQELMFAIGVDDKWRVAEAFARGVIARR